MKVFCPQSVPFPSRRDHSLSQKSLIMSLLLLIVLILFLVGGLPNFGYHSYGYAPSGLAGVLVNVLLVLILAGRF